MAKVVHRARAADSRLPLLALCGRWLLIAYFAAGAAAASFGGSSPFDHTKPISYTSGSSGGGQSLAQLVPPGDTPDPGAVGRDMTVLWEQSVLTGGTPATGYIVRRYDDTSGLEQTILSNCDGIVTGLSCVEAAVPTGTWRYTLTPVFNTWTGTEGLKSSAQVTSPQSLVLFAEDLTALPETIDGTVTGFADGEGLSFHLNGPTGPLLAGTPTTVPSGATTAVTVTVPAGTAAGDISVFAVGDLGSLASEGLVVVDPPVLTGLQMFDVNANGKVDQVVATFSKTLATYTAGPAPWTLTGVPSGGTLSAVAVGGNTATLTIAEGASAADTSVGAFTIALAANAAGIRNTVAQPASFAATAPSDLAPPVAITRQMFDLNANGKVDSTTVAFSESLATYTAANAPWTLSAVPSGGTLASVSVIGATATLSITEGGGAVDTSVGSFTVALATNSGGIRDGAGNLSSFGATAPTDKALPVRLSMVMQDTNANGKVDHVAMTFSETLATYTAGMTGWALASVPSTGTLASVAASTNTATLTLNEGAGAVSTVVGSFTVTLAANAGGIRDAAGNLTSWAATAPTDGAAPVLLTLNMNDANANGKVDQVTAIFTENLGTYSAGNTPWTLVGVPSGGTLASVATATTTATLTINEGAGAADTAVGSMTVALATNATGAQDAAGNQSVFAATTPLDKAKPIRVTMVMQDTNANGKVDHVAMTFSETLATYTAGITGWTLTSAPSTDTLATVAASGTTATLTLNEGAGAATTAVGSFTITLATNAGGIRDAAANLSSWTATAPTDGAAPVLLTLNMNDANANGKVDQVTAVFTETLGTYSAGTTPWTLTGVPSGGALVSVTAATTTATLTITEGAGVADTTVGSMTIAMVSNAGGVQDAFGNVAPTFGATTPLDKAKPARLTMVMQDTNANGKIDHVAMTFSETLSTYTAGVTGWTFASVPSTGTLASVAASGTSATLTFNEGAAAASTAVGSFTVTLATNAGGIRDAAGNLTSWAAAAPTDGAAPVLLTLNMNDTTLNGKVDQVTAVFTETLGTYTAATAPWTLTGVPSGGTLASVATATTTATLTITEGAGTADTTVGSMTVAMATNALGIKDVAGNVGPAFGATTPLDKAKPERLTMVMNDTNGNGKVDQVAMTFTESLAAYTAGATPWTLTSPPSTATFGSVTTSGAAATMTMVEGPAAATTAIGSFKLTLVANAAGIRDAAGNQTAFASTAPTDGAAPAIVSLTMTDTSLNGKVDHATAVFSETLSAYTAGIAPWTLTGAPSGGTLSSVAVATATATLTLTEGAGAADTTTGAFTIAMAANAAGVRDGAGNLGVLATTAPADKAAPARLTMLMNDTNGNGKVDQLAMTFSETLDAYTAAGTPWTFAVAPSGATFGSFTTSGATATLALTEGAAAPNTAVGTFTIALAANAAGVRDVAQNLTTWAAAAPTDHAAPVLVTLTMQDTNTNGKVDHVAAVFSETLSAYTAGVTPWTLVGVPSGGTLTSVAVATTTATLTLAEGAGAADTTVGSFTIAMATSATGVRDAALNLGTFATTAPIDGAGPVALTMSTTTGLTQGLIAPGDTFIVTFSEPLAPGSVPSTVTVTESDPSGAGFDTLTITGVTSGARSTGSDAYVVLDGLVADFTSSTTALTNANTTLTVTVGPSCSNTGCASLGTNLTAASLSFGPAATLTDITGNAAVGTLATVLRLF